MESRTHHVYILANFNRSLYIGFTGNLEQRICQHREGILGGHTAKYRIHNLVHFESFDSPLKAITREKDLKSWTRRKKIELIERDNPGWLDLSAGWGQSANR